MTVNTTLVAIATAPGRGGIGVVRLSGSQALSIAKQLAKRGELRPRYAHFCTFYDAQHNWLDEGLAIYFPAPHSFTGEDVVELQGHGGPVVLDRLVNACLQLGAVQAGPGEFSLRAFLNDKMDLTQAEAIADLIDASTESAAKAAMHSLQGAFSQEVDALVKQLIELRVYVEAAIDFPDEEIDFLSDGGVQQRLEQLIEQTKQVTQAANQGRILRDGITIALAGKPNAGKSSLLNALAGQEVAIVTNLAGTTRDVLRETIQIDGIPLHLVDTAGLRETSDVIEQEGIKRAKQAIEGASAVLFLLDANELEQPINVEKLVTALPFSTQAPVVLVLNKSDLSGITPGVVTNNKNIDAYSISAKNGAGLAELKHHLKQMAGWQENQAQTFSARRRHLQALSIASECLHTGKVNLQEHQAGELLAQDLRQAQQALEEITGRFTADDLLGEIFSSFCIGK